MASSLILHKRINTTVAKAKALRMYVEPLLTKAKEDTTHSRRVVFSYLQNKFAVTELFREISGKISDRPGGYTRVIKLGKRLGDNAEMAMIELVDYNEHMLAEKGTKKKKTTRRRGGSKKTADTAVAETTATKVEKPKAEEVKKEVKAEVKEEKKVVEKKEVKAEEKKESIAKDTADKKGK
jgi:large subunit ribosomal protein L17